MREDSGYCPFGPAGMERIKAIRAFMSGGFKLVRGMPPCCMRLVWCRRRLSRVPAGSSEAVPARGGAAIVPVNPPTPWQVSHDKRWKICFPCKASGLSGGRGAACAGGGADCALGA